MIANLDNDENRNMNPSHMLEEELQAKDTILNYDGNRVLRGRDAHAQLEEKEKGSALMKRFGSKKAIVNRAKRNISIMFGTRDPMTKSEQRDVKFSLVLSVLIFVALAMNCVKENGYDYEKWVSYEREAARERVGAIMAEGAVREIEGHVEDFYRVSVEAARVEAEREAGVACPPKRKCPPKPVCEDDDDDDGDGNEDDVDRNDSSRRRKLLAPASSIGENGNENNDDSSSSKAKTKERKAADDPFLDDLVPKNGKHDFKIFVYDLKPEYNANLARDQPRCRTDQYGTEIRFHENLLEHAVLTKNAEEAEFFFVPIYGECYLFRETQNSGTNNAMKVTNLWYREALATIQNEYPYWNRTDGRDHVWSFPGARGPHIFRDWKKLIKKSIFLTPEGDRSFGEQFNTWKDIVIPGLEPDSEFIEGKLRKQSSLKKDIFAFFRGTILNKAGILAYSRGIRPKMEEAFKKHKDVIFTEELSSCDRDCYRKELRRSTFCLCPRGWSPWTLRAYQAMMVGCIPVIIADEIELPYENALDWTKLSVKIAEADAEKTIDILKLISKNDIKNKQKAIEKVWRSIAWGANPKKLDAMDAMEAVLHELGRKKRLMKASTRTFW